MRLDEIETTYDLADLLEQAVKTLRDNPSFELSGSRSGKGHPIRSSKRRGGRESVDERVLVMELAEQIPNMMREEAELRLEPLKIASLKELAREFGIRVPSKALKSEYIQMLLTQLFDVPEGQQLIRTFHERHRT